ncbi:hypothetical protein B1A99_29585 [Cohnella sp. CIP 111063]|uniref:FHA domain-containing protein n=1 Tax=unclassified Cohnella TaxID=2636738 RepID=UPI000B8C4EC1|nr:MULTISPECIES: FHA domain-containing protein [unclassified Cohnella]OXS53527.1 hypothetical protein B1A99_29585 [Cohnella sp. CIP 111063]PRX61549.1 FHA domain-containing protein [Cohnella sp. SGD-V74]
MAEQNRSQRERGPLKFREGRRSCEPFLAAIAGAGALLLPGRAFASEMRAVNAAAQIGTLPLLAALGIGIAVAVFAVVAFLQLTVKGRETIEAAEAAMKESELADDQRLPDWNDEEATANEEDAEEHALTDYTIPMTQLLTLSGAAEAAAIGEPMLCGVEGEHEGSCYRVLNRRLTFGRDPARCGILFPYEATDISRVHCTLRYVEDSRVFVLEDNGSSNGTFLQGGERLKPGHKYELRSGDRFSLSGERHWFEVRDAERN